MARLSTVCDNHMSAGAVFKGKLQEGISQEDTVKLQDFARHLARKELAYQAALNVLFNAIKSKARADEVKRQAMFLLEDANRFYYIYNCYYHHPKKFQHYRLEVHYLRLIVGTTTNEALEVVTAKKPRSNYLALKEMQRTSFIREMTARINWYRLFFLIRMRRFFKAVGDINSVSQGYKSFVSLLDKAGPALNYIGWIFYVPRFIANVCLLIKHTLPVFMDEEEKSIAWKTRLTNELSKRWFELANDSIWLTVGLINCFLLTGHAALFLTVGLYLFDVFAAIGQSLHTLSRYSKAIKDIESKQNSMSIRTNIPSDQAEYDALEQQKLEINRLRTHEVSKIKLNISVATGLFVCMGLTALALTLPTGIGVGVVIAAALLTLMVCLIQKVMQKRLEKSASSQQATAMKAHGLFKSTADYDEKPLDVIKVSKKESDPIPVPQNRRSCREEVKAAYVPNPWDVPTSISL